MPRSAPIALLALICFAQASYPQRRGADVPPIPEQERFVPRNDLTATLRLITDTVQIGELPQAKLILKNVGAKRLLIRTPTPEHATSQNPQVRVYSESGEQLPTQVSMCRCIWGTARMRDMIALEPQQELEVELRVPYAVAPAPVGAPAPTGTSDLADARPIERVAPG